MHCVKTDIPKENRVHLVYDKNTYALRCERRQKPNRFCGSARYFVDMSWSALRSRLPSTAVVAYISGVSALTFAIADDKLHLRQWTTTCHRIAAPPDISVSVSIRSKVRAGASEIGQGCVDWPAGRALLQWAIAGGVPLTGATVLEVGAGVGLTSIGCALSAQQRAVATGRAPSLFLASDVCDAALANAKHNAAHVSNEELPLKFCKWNAAGGLSAVKRLPMDAACLTHVIGADLVSAPVFEASPLTDDDDHDGLEATLSALLAVNPKLSIHLVLTNRCAGGAVSALAGSAGVQHIGGMTFDPALFRFERRCARLGLAVERQPLPEEIVRQVSASQPLHVRFQWWLASTWDDGLLLYTVRRSA